MKKILIHIGFIVGIGLFSILSIAGGYAGGGAAVAAFFIASCAWLLAAAYRSYIIESRQPAPADDVKVNIMPMSEFQQKYGGTFKVSNLATGETLFTTTPPTPDPFDISDMD